MVFDIKKALHALQRATLVETHISWVLLTKDYVYKIKKPVKFSFLDFSTIENRLAACNDEVSLNRRLSPELYIGVVPITEEEDGSLSFGNGSKKAIEYAVKMKKVDPEDRLDILISKNRVTQEDIARIADKVSKFHSEIETIDCSQNKYGSPQTIWDQIADLGGWKTQIEDAAGCGHKVDLLLSKSNEFLDKNNDLFEKRRRDGNIKNCHGDLHSGNIFIVNGEPVIFDCIEFNKNFRFIDVISEVAFMAMDLDASGRRNFSDVFVDRYNANAKDMDLKKLLDFYKCYRANVRAKIAAIEWSNGKSKEAAKRIEKYMGLAEEYANRL